jgi:hypothetical protein
VILLLIVAASGALSVDSTPDGISQSVSPTARKVCLALPHLRKASLYTTNRNAALFLREVKAAVHGTHSVRHIRTTADPRVHRWPCRTLERLADLGRPRLVTAQLCETIVGICVVREVTARVLFAVVAQDGKVVGVVAEFDSLRNVTSGEGEDDDKRRGKPEVGRGKHIVVIAVDGCDNPSWGDSGVDQLYIDVLAL